MYLERTFNSVSALQQTTYSQGGQPCRQIRHIMQKLRN
jgi:hypothetical protein